MAHLFSKEDLDEQFEQFLRESLSDDSVGNEPKKKSSVLETLGQARNEEVKKHPIPWWITEDDLDDCKARFIKQGHEKKTVGKKNEMIEDGEKKMPPSNNQSVKLATPKPFSSTSHSKTLAKFSELEKSLKAKKSVHLNKEEIPAIDDHTEGICGKTGSFLKSQRLSYPIVEADEDNAESAHLPQPSDISVSLSRDSLETNVLASGPNENFLGSGLNTLEEEEEKERFFANLEKGVSSTIDYSRLNKELDSNDSELLQAFPRDHTGVKQMEEGNEEEQRNHEKSGDYSEDFEDSESKEDSKVEQVVTSEPNEKKTGMLAKVVLLDSQDSTVETQKVCEQQEVAVTDHHLPQDIVADEINGTAVSGGQTNKDLEALCQAYCRTECSLGVTGEQKTPAGTMEMAQDSLNDAPRNGEEYPKNTSTPDSSLPTVEELMKPFRADSSFARDSDLQLVSSVNVAHSEDGQVSHLPLEEHQNDSSLEKQDVSCPGQQHKRQGDLSVQTCETEGSCHHGNRKDNQTKMIKPDALGQNVVHQDVKTNQAHLLNKKDLGSVMNKQVMQKNMKTTEALHKKKSLSGPYSFVRSSGYGRSNSPLKRFTTVNEKKVLNEAIEKPILKAKSARTKGKEIFSGTKTIQTSKPVCTERNFLAATGQSSASCLQHQDKERNSSLQNYHVSSHSPAQNSGKELYLFKRVQETETKLAVAQDLIDHLKAASLQKEKEMEAKILEIKMQHERDFFQLNQEKYVLQTQLNNREDLNKGVKWTDICERNPGGGEMLKEIQKEIQTQETLLQGYQQENERLYQQVKELQIKNKKNEENMFKENQCLMTELATLREQLDKNNLLSRGVQNSEPKQSFTDLILELGAAKEMKAAETNLLEERKRLKQDKQALEVELEQVKKERDLARAQIASTSDAKSYEMKIMEESYKEELGRLQKRLQWYAENQEILDKDTANLRRAKIEIDKLKQEVDRLRTEAGNQLTQQKKRLKDRAADAKQIQDLERQVKEMEGILKRRHPNSLPALIYAAATVSSDGGGDASSKTSTVDFLERRIKKLEAELESKDDDCKKSLRAMEQQFQKIKHQYEKRVSELEQLLAYKLPNDPQKLQNKTGSTAALEEELRSTNKAHQITVKNLQEEIDSLQNQIAQLKLQKKEMEDANMQSLEFQVEQAHAKAMLVRLNQDLVAKSREIQDLTRTVERLQKERRIMLSNKGSGGQTESKEKPAGTVKKVIFDSKNVRNEEFFAGSLDKIYQPSAFADSHISEVLQENAQLKNKVEKMTLELSQQRVKSQAELARSESIIQRNKDLEEYIAALNASHQKEMEKILCQYAVEHSTSKVAQLNSKISTQEILIKHLQQQLHELQRDQEALKVSQMREEILQKEMGKLLEELREAKESQRPEMKHFLCLERKIRQLEARYAQREQELQQVMQLSRHTAEVEPTQEIEKWRKLTLLKNQELEKFRIELDSMLDILRQLQKQGVIIPAGGSSIPESYWKI